MVGWWAGGYLETCPGSCHSPGVSRHLCRFSLFLLGPLGVSLDSALSQGHCFMPLSHPVEGWFLGLLKFTLQPWATIEATLPC